MSFSGSSACRNRICADPGILVEPLESLITPELRFHPIERSLLCQASAKGCRGFATVLGQARHLALQLFLAHLDVFRRGNAVEQQFGLHVFDGTVALAAPQRTQSTLTARGSTP